MTHLCTFWRVLGKEEGRTFETEDLRRHGPQISTRFAPTNVGAKRSHTRASEFERFGISNTHANTQTPTLTYTRTQCARACIGRHTQKFRPVNFVLQENFLVLLQLQITQPLRDLISNKNRLMTAWLTVWLTVLNAHQVIQGKASVLYDA